MNIMVAKYINVALGVVLIIFIALFMKRVVVSKYTLLNPIDVDMAAGSSARSGDLLSVAFKGGARFAQYAPIVEGGLFGPVSVFKFLGENARAGTAVAKGGGSIKSISLLGTVVGVSGAGGYGLFKDVKSSRQDIFKVGDKVFKVGRLTHVDRFTATIVSSGVSFTLTMPKSSKMGALSSVPGRGRRRSSPFGSLGRTPTVRAGDRVLARKVGEREWTVDRRALDEALSDTGNLLTQARILPYRVNGKTKGFRLSSLQRSGIFALIGLRSGDILLKVNERAMDSPEKGLELLSALGGESNISLDILRGGKPTKLNYEIR